MVRGLLCEYCLFLYNSICWFLQIKTPYLLTDTSLDFLVQKSQIKTFLLGTMERNPIDVLNTLKRGYRHKAYQNIFGLTDAVVAVAAFTYSWYTRMKR